MFAVLSRDAPLPNREIPGVRSMANVTTST